MSQWTREFPMVFPSNFLGRVTKFLMPWLETSFLLLKNNLMKYSREKELIFS